MHLYRTLLEDFAQEVEAVYLAQNPDSEELIRLCEDIENLIQDSEL